MMRKSDWEYVAFTGEPDTIFIRDLDLGGTSVTNDAEAVVREINFAFPGKRIVYRDSNGDWDELIHEDGRFIEFGTYKGPTPV